MLSIICPKKMNSIIRNIYFLINTWIYNNKTHNFKIYIILSVYLRDMLHKEVDVKV